MVGTRCACSLTSLPCEIQDRCLSHSHVHGRVRERPQSVPTIDSSPPYVVDVAFPRPIFNPGNQSFPYRILHHIGPFFREFIRRTNSMMKPASLPNPCRFSILFAKTFLKISNPSVNRKPQVPGGRRKNEHDQASKENLQPTTLSPHSTRHHATDSLPASGPSIGSDLWRRW